MDRIRVTRWNVRRHADMLPVRRQIRPIRPL